MPAKSTPYFVALYPCNTSTPWKLELRASFAGKRIQKYFRTKEEAEAAGPVIVAEIRVNGVPALNKKVSTGVLLSGVLATYRQHKVNLMKGSHQRIAIVVFRALEEKFGAMPMDSIAPLELEKWIHSRGSSPTTGATYNRYIRMFWRWAYKKELIEKNTIERVDSPVAKTRLNIFSKMATSDIYTLRLYWSPNRGITTDGLERDTS